MGITTGWRVLIGRLRWIGRVGQGLGRLNNNSLLIIFI